MKKILAVLLFAVLIIGCGPKMAKQETLDTIAEARAALEAAQARIAELEAERSALEARMAELEQGIMDMNEEIDIVQDKIDTKCKKMKSTK
ncbi:MAG: hypothetical protein JSV97_07995 [candidate division WOR-3 bacterium]|nr:MAG: hypothetical protein JSV97_07995 [candidate division WOR-3 bacterium]